jgi:salicylate hydroxylase
MFPDANGDIGTAALDEVFQNYAELRQPRTAAKVNGRKSTRQLRVTSGEEACKRRNEMVRKMYADEAAVKARLTPCTASHSEARVEESDDT